MRRNGWTGRVLILALVVAMIGILLPDPAHAQKNVTSRFDVTLGGFVETNAVWDSDESPDGADGTRKFSVVKGSEQEGRETLRWTAVNTRLYTAVRGPDLWGAKSSARVEGDFAGFQDGAGTSHTFRLRRAFMRLDWPSVWLLIGQETMPFTGAVSSKSEVSGTTSGSRADKPGGPSRFPQIQVGTSIPMGMAKVDLVGAIGRNNTRRSGDSVLNDSGARAVTPAVNGIAKGTIKAFGRDAVFAVSGYWGEETITLATAEADVNNTGLALEWLVPLGPALPGVGAFDFRGNFFTGQNMHRWNLGTGGAGGGGITSTTPALADEIQSDGWWAELNWDITRNFGVGVGTGRMEDDKGDLTKAGGTQVLENEGQWIHFTWTDGPWLFQVQYINIDTTRLATASGAETGTDSQEVYFVFRYTF